MTEQPLYTARNNGKKLEIYRDNHPDSPRNWDNMAEMALFHSKYDLGDDVPFSHDQFDGWAEMREYIKNELDAVAVLPVYLYDHGNITISTEPFNNPFDSGQIGFIYITEDHLEDMGHDEIPDTEKLKDWMQGDVDTYRQYLEGEVYGFKLYETSKCDHGHEHKEEQDSCWGFYGTEWEENGLLDHLPDTFSADDIERVQP